MSKGNVKVSSVIPSYVALIFSLLIHCKASIPQKAQILPVTPTPSWHREPLHAEHRIDSQDDQIQIRETWNLNETKRRMTATLVRQIVFKTLGPKNYACSQTKTYALTQRMELEGEVASDRVRLRVKRHEALDHPCAPKWVTPQPFELKRRSVGLIEVKQGANTWQLSSSPLSKPISFDTSTSLKGVWQWSNRSTTDRTIRSENETWSFTAAEGKGQHFSGTYERSVEVQSNNGQTIRCAKAKRYHLTDRYTIRGRRHNNTLFIVETNAEAQSHPCAGKTRTLDAAQGRIFHDTIQLKWRGNISQTLSRSQ